MKKKGWISGLIAVLFLIVVLFLAVNQDSPEKEYTHAVYSLFVNGKRVWLDTEVYICYENGPYAEIPIVAVMEALGAKVEWMDTTTARMILNGKHFVLDLTNGTFSDEGGGKNYFCPPPGTTRGLLFWVKDQELIVDSDSLTWFFRAIDAECNIEYTHQKVCITTVD